MFVFGRHYLEKRGATGMKEGTGLTKDVGTLYDIHEDEFIFELEAHYEENLNKSVDIELLQDKSSTGGLLNLKVTEHGGKTEMLNFEETINLVKEVFGVKPDEVYVNFVSEIVYLITTPMNDVITNELSENQELTEKVKNARGKRDSSFSSYILNKNHLLKTIEKNKDEELKVSEYKKIIENYGKCLEDIKMSPLVMVEMLQLRSQLESVYHKLNADERRVILNYDVTLIHNAKELLVYHIGKSYDLSSSTEPLTEWWWHLNKVASGEIWLRLIPIIEPIDEVKRLIEKGPNDTKHGGFKQYDSVDEHNQNIGIADDEDIWRQILDILRTQLSHPAFEKWFQNTTGELNGDTFVIKAFDECTCDWIQRRYSQDIIAIYQKLTGKDVRLHVVSKEDDSNKITDRTEHASFETKQDVEHFKFSHEEIEWLKNRNQKVIQLTEKIIKELLCDEYSKDWRIFVDRKGEMEDIPVIEPTDEENLMIAEDQEDSKNEYDIIDLMGIVKPAELIEDINQVIRESREKYYKKRALKVIKGSTFTVDQDDLQLLFDLSIKLATIYGDKTPKILANSFLLPLLVKYPLLVHHYESDFWFNVLLEQRNRYQKGSELTENIIKELLGDEYSEDWRRKVLEQAVVKAVKEVRKEMWEERNREKEDIAKRLDTPEEEWVERQPRMTMKEWYEMRKKERSITDDEIRQFEQDSEMKKMVEDSEKDIEEGNVYSTREAKQKLRHEMRKSNQSIADSSTWEIFHDEPPKDEK